MLRLEIALDEEEMRWLEAQGEEPTTVIHALIRKAQEDEALDRLLLERVEKLDRGEGKPVTEELWDRLEKTAERAAARRKG